jgi:hypothetical protein
MKAISLKRTSQLLSSVTSSQQNEYLRKDLRRLLKKGIYKKDLNLIILRYNVFLAG